MRISSRKMLERSAEEDLWRNTLSQIPSVFNRLVYLTSLRDRDSGRYAHDGLAMVFGDDEAHRALRRGHQKAFGDWLSFGLEQQKADLDLYLSELQVERRVLLGHWLETTPFRNLVPSTAKPIERKLYLADFKAILQLLMNVYGVSEIDPDA